MIDYDKIVCLDGNNQPITSDPLLVDNLFNTLASIDYNEATDVTITRYKCLQDHITKFETNLKDLQTNRDMFETERKKYRSDKWLKLQIIGRNQEKYSLDDNIYDIMIM